MERSFIATKESEYVKSLNEYMKLGKQQNEFVKKFFNEKGIETSIYMVSGDGSVNRPFEEFNKKEIKLSIQPSEDDLYNFPKILCAPNKNNGLYTFKKSSSISKEFSQKCIDEQIIINLYAPRASEYFSTLGFHGCSYTQFPSGEDLYIKVESKYLKENDTPEGFNEIKLSEFYIAKEKFELERL